MRFLVQWQHVTGATQHRDADGLARVIGQLQGYETAVGAWESQVLARRVRDYDPAWLDRLCHQGEVTWLRLAAAVTGRPGSPPGRRHPHHPRLAGAARRPAVAARRPPTARRLRPCPACGAVAEVVEVLAQKGACFASELAQGQRPAPRRGRGGAVGGDGARPARVRRVRIGAGRRLWAPTGPRHHVPTSSPADRRRAARHRDRGPMVPRARGRHRHRS